MTLWVILASATLTVMAGSVISPTLNLMAAGLGMEHGAARIIITTHGIIVAICSPFIGILIDRIGMRKPFIIGLIIYAIAGGSGLLITDYWMLIVSRIVFGTGVAAIFTSITVIILNLYKGERKNKVMGWRGSSNSVGGFTWPLLGGFLGTFSWHLPFAVYLVGLPLAVLAYLTIPQMPGALDNPTKNTSGEESIFSLFKNTPALYITYGFIFLLNVLLYSLVVFLPELIINIAPVDSFFIGICFSFSSITAGLAAFYYARIRARLSYKVIIFISLAFWTAGFATLSQAFSLWMVILSVALFGVGQGMCIPAVTVWTGELVPATFRGRITSYLATFGYVGQFMSPILLNPVAVALGVHNVFLVTASVCALLFLIFLVFIRK